MRRREKFVITAIVLSLLLLGVLATPASWRSLAVAGLTVVSYLLSAWALSEDLQRHELLTLVPLPTLFTLAVSSFYFVLPVNLLNQVLLLTLYGIGMYALLLTGNIFSVAKGRSIQLLYAAQTVSLFFTLLISFLLSSTALSLNIPLWAVGLIIGTTHVPLVLLSIWSVRLHAGLEEEEWIVAALLIAIMLQLVFALALIPFATWVIALLIMSVLYIQLGLAQSYLRGRLFSRTVREYSLVAVFVTLLFIALFPGK